MTQKVSAKIIRYVSYVIIVFSVIWGLAPYESINAPARILIDILDWPFGDALATLDRNTMWLSSIGTGLMLALAIFYGWVIAPAIERGDKQIVKVGIWAILAWYVVDSTGSVASGVASNVLFNTPFLLGMLLPMVMVKYKF